MTQATAELPNTMHQTPAPPSAADDLLSQMAGEQIDRMLADADAKPPDPGSADIAPPPTVAIDAPELKELLAPAEIETDTPAVAAQTPPTAPATIDDATSAAEKEALAAPVEIPLPAVTVAPPTPIAAPLPEKKAEKKPAERDSLPVRMLVKALELLNAPFAACPAGMRDMLGRIAILTLLNAIGVILYVVLFKPH